MRGSFQRIKRIFTRTCSSNIRRNRVKSHLICQIPSDLKWELTRTRKPKRGRRETWKEKSSGINPNGRIFISQFCMGDTTIDDFTPNQQSFSMTVISQNVRGLNNRVKQRYLQDHLKNEKPRIVLLQETKVTRERIEAMFSRMHPRYEVITFDARGSAGGITVLQNPTEILFNHQISMPFILSRSFKHIGAREWVLISAIYSPHNLGEKEAFLQNLGNL